MTGFEKIEKLIMENGGIAKTSDFTKNGINGATVAKLCDNGLLQKVRVGYYQLAKNDEPNEEKIIAGLFPDGVVCMDTALFYYGYSDRTPLEWTLAFDRNISRSRLKINYPRIKPYFLDKKYLAIGTSKIKMNGVSLQIFNRERVICDCFKYRNKLEAEMFNKAVAAYAKDPKRNLRNLSIYAKQLRVFNKVNEVMGVLF